MKRLALRLRAARYLGAARRHVSAALLRALSRQSIPASLERWHCERSSCPERMDVRRQRYACECAPGIAQRIPEQDVLRSNSPSGLPARGRVNPERLERRELHCQPSKLLDHEAFAAVPLGAKWASIATSPSSGSGGLWTLATLRPIVLFVRSYAHTGVRLRPRDQISPTSRPSRTLSTTLRLSIQGEIALLSLEAN